MERLFAKKTISVLVQEADTRHHLNGRWKRLAVVTLFFLVATVRAQTNLRLEGIPGPLTWHNAPKASHIDTGKILSVSSGPKTDWFVDPFDGTVARNAPILSFAPGKTYVIHTKVQVQFATKWDAGALMVWADDHHWAKLSFELSPDKKPTLVTVVTRGLSDDSNSVSITGDIVYLQIARTGSTYVFYYGTDGETWQVLRTFSLETGGPTHLGFESQSPAGTGSTAVFSETSYSPRKISNIYTGK
jgi:regulation of enolase protein 1 (concanavalin A-like superfamily)